MEKYDVVVVGGGIAGLAAAHRLRGKDPAPKVLLLERDPRLGGKILTEAIDGFVIEGGPDSFLSYKPRGLGLCRELGLDGELQGPRNTGGAAVRLDGHLHRIPEGLSGLVPARLGPIFGSALLSIGGRVRVALERFVPARHGDDDETLAGFMSRRFGQEAYDRLIEPLMAGIYAGDGRELSLEATFPQLREAERAAGSVVGGLAVQSRPRPSGPAFLSPRAGMGDLVNALERELQGVVRTDSAACRIEETAEGFRIDTESGESMETRAVILATPTYVAASLLDGLDERLACELAAIPYASVITVSLAYPLNALRRPPFGSGYIVPSIENQPVLACTWSSRKWDHRAPEDSVLVRAYLGRARDGRTLQLDDREILRIVEEELEGVLGVSRPPLFSRIYRWPQAMPQYVLGHKDRVHQIERLASTHPGLYLAGHAYRGIGIPDCIQTGEDAAGSVLKFLVDTKRRQRPAEVSGGPDRI
ncbi:MAG: protoporphyrinogen oxidase [Chloroflexota bacterium]